MPELKLICKSCEGVSTSASSTDPSSKLSKVASMKAGSSSDPTSTESAVSNLQWHNSTRTCHSPWRLIWLTREIGLPNSRKNIDPCVLTRPQPDLPLRLESASRM